MQSWKDCLIKNGKSISDREFDKFLVSNYVRFDTCSNKESKQAGNKYSLQNFDYVLAKTPTIFDFEHAVLDELKAFLKLFK